ncbi:unnamed protein product [Meganyctiphanes norvegica]|uniref:Uncharacterized protein n=1 Tax=Meganyctiphanes norvegica TaxID=48144 RepID=A0AAV2QLB0_MEGNR
MHKELLFIVLILVALAGVEARSTRSLDDDDDFEERRVYEAPAGRTADATIEQTSHELLPGTSKESVEEIVLDSEENTWHVGASYWYSSPLLIKK